MNWRNRTCFLHIHRYWGITSVFYFYWIDKEVSLIVHPFERDMRFLLDNSYRVEAIVCLTRAYYYDKFDSPCGYYESGSWSLSCATGCRGSSTRYDRKEARRKSTRYDRKEARGSSTRYDRKESVTYQSNSRPQLLKAFNHAKGQATTPLASHLLP